jgi:peptide/nickel transport system substrate-binding protein
MFRGTVRTLRPGRKHSRRALLSMAGHLGKAAPAIAAIGFEATRSKRISTSAQTPPGQTLTVASNWSPVDIDPHGAHDPGSGLVVSGMYESLIKIRPGTTREYLPALAESWEPNDDFSSWTFRLREGVLFHDGSPCNAEAVRASFERLLALALAPASITGRFLHSPDQIRIVDDLTIRFDLDQPQRLFEAAIAAPYGTRILNVVAALQHELEGDWGHGWSQSNAEGLGTGPYRLVSYDPADRAVLERFESYWGGWEGEHFDRIVVRSVPEGETRRELIEQGDVDIVENIPREAVDSLIGNESLHVDREANLLVHYLAMTVAGPLASPQARQALCWAFPYDEVLQGIYLGYAQQGRSAVSDLCQGFAPVAQFTTDLARARALIEEAGLPGGTTLTTVYAPGNALVQSIVELFQANLARIDIHLEIEPVDFASYTSMLYSNLAAEDRPNLLPLLWQPDYDDAWSQLWPTTACDAWTSGNIGHYCNDEVDELLLVARDTTDEAVYLDSLARVQQIVAVDDPVAIYLAQPEWITVLRSDVGGFVLNKLAGEVLDYFAMFRIS